MTVQAVSSVRFAGWHSQNVNGLVVTDLQLQQLALHGSSYWKLNCSIILDFYRLGMNTLARNFRDIFISSLPEKAFCPKTEPVVCPMRHWATPLHAHPSLQAFVKKKKTFRPILIPCAT